MTIKLFLASSSELKKERDEFEKFIRRKNDEWRNKNIYLKLTIWEDFIDAISQGSLQHEYNKAVKGSDIFIMLFFTKVGKYTEIEFENAFGEFKKTNKPLIYTYFKNDYIKTGDIKREEILSLLDFKQKLSDLDHYLTYYENTEDLLHRFNTQLAKLNEKYSWENHQANLGTAGNDFFRIRHAIDQDQPSIAMLELREHIKNSLEQIAIQNDFQLQIKAPMHVLHDLAKMNVLSPQGLGMLEYALSVTDKAYNKIPVSKEEAQKALQHAEEGLEIIHAEKKEDNTLGSNAHFQLYTTYDKYHFELIQNGNVLLQSERFMTKAALMNCIESVRKNSQSDSRFSRKTAKNGKLYFNLIAANGQIIGSSDLFSNEEEVEKTIQRVTQVSKSAAVLSTEKG